jgi:hypothetical protein
MKQVRYVMVTLEMENVTPEDADAAAEGCRDTIVEAVAFLNNGLDLSNVITIHRDNPIMKGN